MQDAAAKRGIKVLSNERYARTDNSVTAQILKITSMNPDAVLVGGSGTPGALPHLCASAATAACNTTPTA